LVGGNLNTDKTDNVNLIPYGRDDINNSDYIPFKFYDMNNDKHIVFRATLSGISDSYSPEWSSQRYIGRPDNVHVYQGVSRELSFDFVVAPFSKQEMLVCWEKLNYLAGLTYPTWKKIGNTSRMDAPFTALTIGNMFSKTPGYINSLSYTIEDNVSWDIDKNNQVPQVVNVSVTFTHIGRHKLASQGKHYDLPWLKSLESGTEPYTYKISNKHENDGGIFGELPDGEVMLNQVQDPPATSTDGNNAAIATNLDESGAVPDGTGNLTMGDSFTAPTAIQ